MHPLRLIVAYQYQVTSEYQARSHFGFIIVLKFCYDVFMECRMRLQSLSVLFLIATLNQPVFARNILNEQTDAAAARDAVGDAMSKLSDLEQRIKSQEALVAQEQAKLKQYQSDKVQTEKDLENKKMIFEQKSKVLDDAWKQRNDY
jgi:septal ring factor EnvC (AmiA/AmiB activator)